MRQDQQQLPQNGQQKVPALTHLAFRHSWFTFTHDRDGAATVLCNCRY